MSPSGASSPSSQPDAGRAEPAGNGTNAAPVIELRGVWKRFAHLEVLCGIDLKLYAGQTTVVIGESGTGKSVLLKHIVGLLKPDAGEVYFKGTRVDRFRERQLVEIREKFGFLFQGGALFDSMTAAENVGFPIVEHGRRRREEVERTVAEKLRMVGLDGIQSKKPAELSGGQRKRVALARAIALDPEVILYDEPTTGLDPPRADVINELILKLKRELQVTGVVVTHDMTSAYKVADRIAMLYEGQFIADGTPDEIRASDDIRVRRFIEGRAGDEELAGLRGE